MVANVTSLNVLALSGLKAAATAAAPKKDVAPAAVGGEAPAPVHPKHASKPKFSPEALSALVGLQIEVNVSKTGVQIEVERGRGHGRSDAPAHGRDKPKKPHPHDPPPAPPPSPAPQPPVVQDSDAPVRFLETVRERIREQPVSQFPDVPFSQRDKAPASAPAAQAQASPFYTPGAFTPAQASAMRTVHQGQAALAMLQAGQVSLYAAASQPANAFRINAFA